MLLPESNIRTGLFAFRCRRRIAVRMEANEFLSPTVINKGQIVVADIERESLDCDCNHTTTSCSGSDENSDKEDASDIDRSNSIYKTVMGDLPRLRLTDGSGWLFKSKSGVGFLEEISLEMGSWTLQCVSDTPVGLSRQPIEREDMAYPCNSVKDKNLIECDVMIPGNDGVTHYRVKGTNGYIYDRRQNGDTLFCLFDPSKGKKAAAKNFRCSRNEQLSWTPDFVRGIGSLVEDVEEVQHDELAKVLSFFPQ